MRELMKTEYLLKGRLEREISRRDFSNLGDEADATVELLKTWTTFNTSLAIHMERFGKFMGYEASESTDAAKAKKVEFMEGILKRDKAKRAEDKKTEEELKAANELIKI